MILLIVTLLAAVCHSFVPPSTRFHATQSALNGKAYNGPELDLYNVLQIPRGADKATVKKAYISLARSKHPDNFVTEMKFTPEDYSVNELKSFLSENKVGTSSLLEKSEFVAAALSLSSKTNALPTALKKRKASITKEWQLIVLAYETLSDKEMARNYNLLGDWGRPNSPSKPSPPSTPYSDANAPTESYSDDKRFSKEEAAKVAERKRYERMDPIQKRVYERTLAEKQEQEELREKEKIMWQKQREEQERKRADAFAKEKVEIESQRARRTEERKRWRLADDPPPAKEKRAAKGTTGGNPFGHPNTWSPEKRAEWEMENELFLDSMSDIELNQIAQSNIKNAWGGLFNPFK